jgi:hypothetical protein
LWLCRWRHSGKYAACLTIDDLCKSDPIYREKNKPRSA